MSAYAFDPSTPVLDPFDPMQEYAKEAVQDLFNIMGITVSNLSVEFDEDDATDTDTFTITTDQTGVVKLAFKDGKIVEDQSNGLSDLTAGYSMTLADIEKWYEFSDPENNEGYALKAVQELFEQVGIYDVSNLKATAQPTENGDYMRIEADSISYNGEAIVAVNMEFTFVDGSLSSKTGIPTELSSIFSDTNVNIWYEYNGPDKQRENDQQDGGFVDDDHQESYSNVWTWTDGQGITWTVVDKEVNGAWTSTETGSNGDVRTHTSSWDHDTQTNTNTEKFVSTERSLDYTRVEESGPNGTEITYTGATDHIGWQPLDQVYTDVNVVEKLDAYWNTLSVTGTAKNTSGTEVTFSYNADNYEILIDGESIQNNFNFDDQFFTDAKEAWTWQDWDGTTWEVSEEDVDGTWTTTETAYTNYVDAVNKGAATGDVRVFTSSWDDSTQTNTWSESFTDTNGMDYTRTEVSTPNGTTITTEGASDHVGWMYLGELYTGLNVTETMDANWNTTDISGSGTNEVGESVNFTWDAANWQILADGKAIDSGNYHDDSNNNEPQKWENTWEWQDGEGVTWTVVDKQEGDVWTSTETGSNGDVRINSSSWTDDSNGGGTNTWSEEVKSESKGLDFTMTEVNVNTTSVNGVWNTTSTITMVGDTDHIGWIPLNGVYTDVNVTETRVNWMTTEITGSGKNSEGNVVAFTLDADGYSLAIDGQRFDPWGDNNQDGGFDNNTDSDNNQTQPGDQQFNDWTGEAWTWTDWNGAVWKVQDQEIDGVWTSTETAYTDDTLAIATGDQRINKSTWSEDGSSTWETQEISTEKGLNFTRIETYNADGTSSTTTTGTGDHIGWMYLGELYTGLNVTEDRNANWETTSVRGSGINADGDTVEFGYEDGQITIDGDNIGHQDYGDDDKSGDNFEFTWDYYDDMGVKWTVTDSQDGDWWQSKEVSDNGDVRVNKSKWSELGDDDNGDGTIGAGDNGAYSKFVSKYKSADESIKYKMVEKYYDNYQGINEQRSVMVVEGTTDMLGWDYLGDVYSDIDFKIVRDGNWNIKKIVSSDDDSVKASAKNVDGDTVYFHENKGEIFITTDETLVDKGRSIYQMNDDFFDYGDGENHDEFEMETGKWEFEYQNQQGQTVSVVDESTATDIITITADSYNGGSNPLEVAIIFDLSDDSVSSIVGVPDGVTGLDKASVESWYQTTILNFEPTGGWEAADADAQEQQFINTAVSDYFSSISLTTTNLVTQFEIDDKWITTETTKDGNGTVVGIMVRGRAESIGTETEREERYETDSDSTAQAKFDAGTPSSRVERSNSFKDNADGGFSMVQAVTSSDGEDFIRTETYNEDGTTTITNIGDIWFDGMLVKGAEITEQLDQHWNVTDFSGTSEIPADFMTNINDMGFGLSDLGATEENTQVLISFEGIGNYGQPQLKFTIYATADIEGLGAAAGDILTWPVGTPDAGQEMIMTNYTAEGDSTLNEYALVDSESYSTSRKDWVWEQDSFSVDTSNPNEVVTTFNGTQSDNLKNTITIVETKKINADGSVNWLDHQITTSKDEDYTINFKVIDRFNPDYDRREGVELEFVGSKEYMGELYSNVDVDKFIDMHTGDVSINGVAKALDGSDVEIFKPEGQRNLEILKIGRDGKQQKMVEDEPNTDDDFDFYPEQRDELYQWNYTDHNNINWTVTDKYEASTGTWSSTETSTAGERSHTDTWTEAGGTSVFVEKLTGQDTYTETRTFSSDYTDGIFKDIQSVVATSESSASVVTTVANYTETMTFNVDNTSVREIDGTLYEFNGEQFKDIDVTETKNANWQTTDLSGTATRVSDDASVVIGFNGVNSWGDPILTFDIGGAGAVVDNSEIANTNPIADNDTYTIDENETLTLDVLSNDTDADSDTLSIKSVGEASNGQVFLLNGSVAYTPDYNYSGADSFTYVVTDGKGGSATATVNITVNAVNEDVVANDDAFTIEQGSLATVLDLTANDADDDGDTITVESIDTTGTNGTVSLDLGVVSYKPDADFSGTDTFTYTVNDEFGSTATATATIVVEAYNTAPTTVDDVATLKEDASVQIDVLGNDTDDADTGNLTIDSVGDASNGTVKLMMGYVFYTPDADYAGTDSFTYVVKDSEGAITTGTVTLTVTARNDAPVATVDVVNIKQDSTALTIDVLANDTDAESDTLSLLKVNDASNGTVAIADGKVTYTPTAGYAGSDSFTYVVGDLDTDGTTIKSKTIGTVNITVSETNVAPDALADVVTVTEDSTANKISVLTNDTDQNGDTLTLDSYSKALYGTTSDGGNNVLYTPDANFEGEDTFTYTVSDGNGGKTTATVTVTVRGGNDDPVAVADALGSISTSKGAVKLDVLANDYDIDSGDSISIKSLATDAESTFAATATTVEGNRVSISSGKVSYTNSTNKSAGSDSFSYTIVDENGAESVATATLTISSNTNPDALNDQITLIEDAELTELDVLSNDVDQDSDKVSILKINTDPEYGTASVSNGKMFYTPDANFAGSDSFTYIVKDGKGGRDEATVTITVTAVNDAPTARNDVATIETGSSATIVDVLGNDVDTEGETLTVTAVQDALKGVVTLTDGVITYTPKAGAVGGDTDSFSYTVSDGTDTATATASITISAVNTAPVASDVDATGTTINEDSRNNKIDVTSSVSDADSDTVSVVSVTKAEHGTASLRSGSIFYEPDADYYGADSFSYTVDDGNGGQDSAVITLAVTNKSDDAVAVDDDLGDIILGSKNNKVDLISNDTDADGDVVEISSVSDAKYGSVSLVNGSVYYTPGSVTGTDVFTYTVTGGDTGTVKANVVAANSEATGSVTISGAAQTGQTLTVSNTLADDDGMTGSTVTYQWYKDGTEMVGETSTTHQISLEEAGSTFSVKATYTDDRGTVETVSSDTTSAVTQLDAPFTFASATVTGVEATAALSGYSFADTDELVKLTLNLNADSIYSRTDIDSITGADLGLNIDWTKFDAIDGSSSEKFVINKVGSDLIALNSSSTSDDDTFDTLALASLRMEDPLLTLVDTDTTSANADKLSNSADLIEVYVRPSADAGKLAIELSGTISANQGQVTFAQYDSTMSNITAVSENSAATGSVTISGTVAVDEVLTASHTLADEDGMGAVSYQWLRDGVEITNATNNAYTITTSDINKDISVKASYTDGGSTAESKTSSAVTVTQSIDNKPLMFTSELITAEQASTEVYGSDYSSVTDEVIVKLTLTADMARLTDASITSIAGVELDFGIDWSLFEDISYADGTSAKYEINKDYTGSLFMGDVTNDSGEITKLVATSLNTSTKPLLTLVDSVDSTGRGVIDQPSTTEVLSIYLNPKSTTKDFEVTYSGDVSVNQGDSSFKQLSHQLEVAAKTYDAIVSTATTAATNDTAATITKLKDVSLNLWEGGSDKGASVAVDTGEISIDSTVTFDAVKLSANAYDFDINISDAIDVLRHIVDLETLSGNAFHAADTDNNGSVNISDAIDILRHIVDLETIDTFDIIDSSGDRVTTLDANSTGDAPTWTIVANGNVDFSGTGFATDYVVTSDLV